MKDRVALERLVEPLLLLARSYEGGREGHACSILQTLFDGYLLVEELFSENPQVSPSIVTGIRVPQKSGPVG